MDLRNLRTFVAIVDAGGVHRAAARLHLTQPAISRRIHALEEELGVPLFDRIGRRVQLTSAGADLLLRSRALLGEADSLVERAVALKKGESGVLRVGATPMTIENTLAPFIAGYRRRHPGIEVQLIEDGGVRLRSRLASGDMQVALTVILGERFRHRALYPTYGVAVTSKEHNLGRRRTIEVAELAREPLLLLHRAFGSREWIDRACDAAHIRPHILLESAAPHTIIALARAGHGIAIVPSTVVIPRTHVHAAPLMHKGKSIGQWLMAGWDAHRFLAPFAERFIAELARYCERTHPGKEFISRASPPPKPQQVA